MTTSLSIIFSCPLRTNITWVNPDQMVPPFPRPRKLCNPSSSPDLPSVLELLELKETWMLILGWVDLKEAQEAGSTSKTSTCPDSLTSPTELCGDREGIAVSTSDSAPQTVSHAKCKKPFLEVCKNVNI